MSFSSEIRLDWKGNNENNKIDEQQNSEIKMYNVVMFVCPCSKIGQVLRARLGPGYLCNIRRSEVFPSREIFYYVFLQISTKILEINLMK